MSTRRNFMQALSSVPFLSGLLSATTLAMTKENGRDYFKELGVKPFINAAGTFTTLSASLMWPEVMEAINYASKVFVPLNDLQEAAGKRIAGRAIVDGKFRRHLVVVAPDFVRARHPIGGR